jgi:hypothetical protein
MEHTATNHFPFATAAPVYLSHFHRPPLPLVPPGSRAAGALAPPGLSRQARALAPAMSASGQAPPGEWVAGVLSEAAHGGSSCGLGQTVALGERGAWRSGNRCSFSLRAEVGAKGLVGVVPMVVAVSGETRGKGV